MAKASPLRSSFNAGEFSILVEGRVDLDRYPASMRACKNGITAPQGPFLSRSGTYFVTECYDSGKQSALVPFVFSDEQALMLEFCDERIRYVLEAGLQAYTPVAVTEIVQLNPLIVTAAGLGAAVGDEIALTGLLAETNLNGVAVAVTNVSTDDYTLDFDATGILTLGAITAEANRLYHIVSPYDHEDVHSIRAVQSVDVIYLFCPGYRPRRLSRYDTYDWRMATLQFDSGPFMDEIPKLGTLTVSATGSPIGSGTPGESGHNGANAVANAFDTDRNTFWESNTDQTGYIEYDFGTDVVIDGYVIYPARSNTDTTYASLDFAPGDWTFLGWDGSDWVTLDNQYGYVLYDNGRSVFFKVNNTTGYSKYRLNITACTRNGTLKPRVARLEMREAVEKNVTVTLSGVYDNFNGGAGFKATDVDRLLRVKASDQQYRLLKIKTFTDANEVVATLLDEPFPDTSAILNWQPGYWSDTTGWPTCGAFFEDRLWVSGVYSVPDLIAGSRTGAYEDFAQRSPINEVLDDSAIVVRLNSRKMASVRWLESDERGLLIGTGTNEWVLSASNPESGISGRNIKARSSSARGSANIDPVKVDRQVLYVQTSRRTVREMAYVFEADGYKSPSMSLFASHLGVPRLAQMCYTGEPHSIAWFRRDDGSVVGLTYNREENVIGWHRHDFGGIVESIATIPSATDLQDTLWLVIKRNLGTDEEPVYKRYIERLMRFWDFDSDVQNAHMVDCGVKYEDETEFTELYGLQHLEGLHVHGLQDGIPFEADVVDGMITLPRGPAKKVVVGLPYESFGEISRMEAGAADGTAQGKMKRTNNVSLLLWDSAYGEIGVFDEQAKDYKWQDIEYPEAYDELQPIVLQTEMVGPFNVAPGYQKRGTLAFRRTLPLPFNVISIMPQLHTQDR